MGSCTDIALLLSDEYFNDKTVHDISSKLTDMNVKQLSLQNVPKDARDWRDREEKARAQRMYISSTLPFVQPSRQVVASRDDVGFDIVPLASTLVFRPKKSSKKRTSQKKQPDDDDDDGEEEEREMTFDSPTEEEPVVKKKKIGGQEKDDGDKHNKKKGAQKAKKTKKDATLEKEGSSKNNNGNTREKAPAQAAPSPSSESKKKAAESPSTQGASSSSSSSSSSSMSKQSKMPPAAQDSDEDFDSEFVQKEAHRIARDRESDKALLKSSQAPKSPARSPKGLHSDFKQPAQVSKKNDTTTGKGRPRKPATQKESLSRKRNQEEISGGPSAENEPAKKKQATSSTTART